MAADGAATNESVARGSYRAAPSRKIVESIVKTIDSSLPQTLGDLFRSNHNYSWQDFEAAVNYLISNGFVEGKGDGFVVRYALTNKGRNTFELET